jgi:hypothetical protein
MPYYSVKITFWDYDKTNEFIPVKCTVSTYKNNFIDIRLG